MKQTKFLSLLLVFVMLLTVQIPICAVGTPAKLIAKQSESAQRNGAVEIYLESDEEVLGGSFNLVYDPSVMQYQNSYSHNGGFSCWVNGDYAPNKVRVSFANSKEFLIEHLMSFDFSPLVGDSCTTVFSIEDVQLYNSKGESVQASGEGMVYEVTVIKEITDVQLPFSELTLGVGEQAQMSCLLTPEDATVDAVIWTSYDHSVATIDENGVITANREGSVTMQCTVRGYNYQSYTRYFTVTVYQKPNVIVSGGYLTVGESITVTVRLDTLGTVYTSGSLNLVYDPTVLSLESAQVGKLLNGSMTTVNESYRENTVRLNFLNQMGISGSGEICLLTFTALQEGEVSIQAEQVLLYKSDNGEHSANTGNGTVGVGEYLLSVNPPTEALALKEFRTSVTFSAAPGVAGGSFVVSYDAEQFRFIGYTDVLTGFSVTVNSDYAPGQIKISFAGSQGVDAGSLVSLRFVSKENPDDGLSAEMGIEEDSVTLYTQSGLKIFPEIRSTTFSVGYNENPIEVGDLDSNGMMDTRDATALLRYLSGASDAILNESVADLNGDGQITDGDMEYLMKLLAGWEPSRIS